MAVQSIPTQSAANFNAFSEPSSITSEDGESKSDSSNSSDSHLKSVLHSDNRRSLQFSFAPLSRQQRSSTLALPAPIRLTLLQRRHHHHHQRASYYGQGHPLIHQIQTHMRSHSQYHIISPCHTNSRSMQLAGKLEDIMSSTMLQSPLNGEGGMHAASSSDNLMENAETDSVASIDSSESCSTDAQANLMHNTGGSKQGHVNGTDEEEGAAACCSADYVYTAPCEHHPSKGQTDYLVNDMFPKLKASFCLHDLSTIEFGIRIADFMPLAFKTVPVAGLAEKELELLHGLRRLPHVIQLQDSFVNDSGDTVLVLPMLKPFDVHAVNNNLCSVRKTMRQVLTGLAAVHAKDIVHLDINPSNLMVTHAKRDVVIIDFGLSMTIANKATIPVCGTTGYIAPEILRPSAYGEEYAPMAADLYSLGIVLGEMLEAYIPDCDLHYFGSKYLGVDNTNQTVAALTEFIAQGACYPKVLVQAADLLKNMLQENPKDRRSAQQLLDSHPFLALGPSPSSPGAVFASTTAKTAVASSGAGSNLELGEWTCRLQEIKYQRYLYQEQRGCEVYRYR
ncbi:hypothetical protein BGW39_002052 [Mortierella sp. 14UC]|nr:hypothetical protein BGW39_002052 [Mortierella sp. 14UC]